MAKCYSALRCQSRCQTRRRTALYAFQISQVLSRQGETMVSLLSYILSREEDTNVTDYATEQRTLSEDTERAEAPNEADASPPTLPRSRYLWESPTQGDDDQSSPGDNSLSGRYKSASTGYEELLPLARTAQDGRKGGLEQKHKESNAPEAKTTQIYLQTIGQATEYCAELLKRQIAHAEQQSPPMNTPIKGDAMTRRAMFTLLPDEMVRSLFLETYTNQNAWPRLRSLFGAPPYAFLRPEDGGFVRAGGIAAGRTHMTDDSSSTTANSSPFGTAHLVDDHLRQYKILPKSAPGRDDPLPFNLDGMQENTLFMSVRVPKRSRTEKIELSKDGFKRRAVLFPMVGEVIHMRYNPELRSIWGGAGEDARAKLKVSRVVARNAHSSTAKLLASRL